MDYLRFRKDLEELWYKRAGHLGFKAFRVFVKYVRNVEIDGIIRLKCKYCACVYVIKVVSRRLLENKLLRLFWRIYWNWFDYLLGYNEIKWLLVIKDEYSETFYGYLVVSKRGEVVIEIL